MNDMLQSRFCVVIDHFLADYAAGKRGRWRGKVPLAESKA
jgi:hypothetical protein